jgi:hypothetical protein
MSGNEHFDGEQAAAAGAGTLGSQGPAASAPQPLALGLQPRPATGFDGDIQL